MSTPADQPPPPPPPFLEATQQQQQQEAYTTHAGHGSVGPVIAVLFVVTFFGVIAGMIGRLCTGRGIFGRGEYDFEGWVERKCSSCIDGHVDQAPTRRFQVPGPDPAEEGQHQEEGGAPQQVKEEEEKEMQEQQTHHHQQHHNKKREP